MPEKKQAIDEEILFGEDEIIVSKTDLRGHLTYANDVFCRVAEMTTQEVIGQPHSIIRHPDMPRAVFQTLWAHIKNGIEVFAFVKNISKTGKYYWVIAHVTPSYDKTGKINGYHSTRRLPKKKNLNAIIPIYERLLLEEQKHPNAKKGLEASFQLLVDLLNEQDKTYSEFIWAAGE